VGVRGKGIKGKRVGYEVAVKEGSEGEKGLRLRGS